MRLNAIPAIRDKKKLILNPVLPVAKEMLNEAFSDMLKYFSVNIVVEFQFSVPIVT